MAPRSARAARKAALSLRASRMMVSREAASGWSTMVISMRPRIDARVGRVRSAGVPQNARSCLVMLKGALITGVVVVGTVATVAVLSGEDPVTVIRVVDGDTIDARVDGKEKRI